MASNRLIRPSLYRFESNEQIKREQLRTVYLKLSRLNPADSSFQRPEEDGAIWGTNGDAQLRYHIIFVYITPYNSTKVDDDRNVCPRKKSPLYQHVVGNLVGSRLIAVGKHLYHLCIIYVIISYLCITPHPFNDFIASTSACRHVLKYLLARYYQRA